MSTAISVTAANIVGVPTTGTSAINRSASSMVVLSPNPIKRSVGDTKNVVSFINSMANEYTGQ